MGSTQERSFVKGVCWEIISFFIALLIVFLLYGNIIISLKISIVLTAVKIPLFFVHERIWKKIKWGKIPEKQINKK